MLEHTFGKDADKMKDVWIIKTFPRLPWGHWRCEHKNITENMLSKVADNPNNYPIITGYETE